MHHLRISIDRETEILLFTQMLPEIIRVETKERVQLRQEGIEEADKKGTESLLLHDYQRHGRNWSFLW